MVWFVALSLWVGCADTPAGSDPTVCCSPGASTSFLKSKLDDDDGDGNPFDEDFPAINDEDDDIADHTWLRDDAGVYHLYFQNEGHHGGSDIEHYTTRDLQGLDYVGVALQRNPDGWDADGLWAPHVVATRNGYFMLYTGVSGAGANSEQRIGLATSSDLVTWTRYPVNYCPDTAGDGCIYECNEIWTPWSEPGSYNRQCRDPFVIWDSAERRWVLFATAKSTNGFGVVTVAYSNDLIHWIGAGYIDATRRLPGGVDGQPTGGQAENPFVMQHRGTYYLLFSDWRDPQDPYTIENPRTGVQYVTSTMLTADAAGSSHWLYRGYTPDPGVNAIEVQRLAGNAWLMSQSISNEDSGDHAHRRELRLKCVVWGDGVEFETTNASFDCRPDGTLGPTGVASRPSRKETP